VLEPRLWPISADPAQLEQEIVNLAVNARDAMPGGGELLIETCNAELPALDTAYTAEHSVVLPGSYVQLSVSDTGIGMDEATRSRLFEPFFTTKETGKGTGLGLSTVYGIVKQSGGYIWAYSEVGKGTTLKTYFPRVEAPVASVSHAQPSPDVPRGEETVLIVEDEPALRAAARRALELCGYTVLAAENAESALRAAAQANRLDLVVTDVVMPGLSGRDLAARLAESQPSVRVLYMSGYTDEAIVHHGVLEPGVAFLEKPFTPDSLARKVREVLDSPAPTVVG
jgi:CheY-like chemotaxis protein